MSCYYANLENEALLHIEGPDALTFLQGQVTCDTRELTTDTALPGLYCTVQGRVICDFLISSPVQDHVMLRMRRDIRDSSAQVLSKYIVFSKARLEPAREDWQVSACWGPDAPQVLQDVFGAVPEARYRSCAGEGFVVVQMDEAGQQFECYLARSGSERQAQLQQRCLPGNEAQWQSQFLAGGIARIEVGTTGEYVPQLLNYDLTGHISFTKGCYTGQEVVARLHYKGKPKRRLHVASLEPANLPPKLLVAIGDPLFSSAASAPVGNVINCVLEDDGRQLMLVTATEAGLDAGLRLSGSEGPLLRLAQLPYPLP